MKIAKIYRKNYVLSLYEGQQSKSTIYRRAITIYYPRVECVVLMYIINCREHVILRAAWCNLSDNVWWASFEWPCHHHCYKPSTKKAKMQCVGWIGDYDNSTCPDALRQSL